LISRVEALAGGETDIDDIIQGFWSESKVRSWRFVLVPSTTAFPPFSTVQEADLERVLRVDCTRYNDRCGPTSPVWPLPKRGGAAKPLRRGCAPSMLCVIAEPETSAHGGFPSPL
jgi:hypothetical protein